MIVFSKCKFLRRPLMDGFVKRGESTSTRNIEKSVIISESHDIYTNLALEDWFYKNWDVTNRNMLMLWTSNPCVVIGKFQNPWLEANVTALSTLLPEGVQLARRNSGGGTVYHDRQNLNLTFFTSKEDYNRKHNLEIITRAVGRRFGFTINISPREDLMVDEYKVSGTASKLGRLVAYHHCTLLVNANKEILRKSLQKPDYEIKTNASQSIKSKVKNLADLDNRITVDKLIPCLYEEYLATKPYTKEKTASFSVKNDIEYVLPTEERFPGITDIRDELKSFEWLYGKLCPKFTAKKRFSGLYGGFLVVIDVECGRIIDVAVEFDDVDNVDCNVDLGLYKDLKFTSELFKEIGGNVTEAINNVKLKEII